MKPLFSFPNVHLLSPATFRCHLKTHLFRLAFQSPYGSLLPAPQIRLPLTVVRVYKLYLLTYTTTGTLDGLLTFGTVGAPAGCNKCTSDHLSRAKDLIIN